MREGGCVDEGDGGIGAFMFGMAAFAGWDRIFCQQHGMQRAGLFQLVSHFRVAGQAALRHAGLVPGRTVAGRTVTG